MASKKIVTKIIDMFIVLFLILSFIGCERDDNNNDYFGHNLANVPVSHAYILWGESLDVYNREVEASELIKTSEERAVLYYAANTLDKYLEGYEPNMFEVYNTLQKNLYNNEDWYFIAEYDKDIPDFQPFTIKLFYCKDKFDKDVILRYGNQIDEKMFVWGELSFESNFAYWINDNCYIQFKFIKLEKDIEDELYAKLYEYCREMDKIINNEEVVS